MERCDVLIVGGGPAGSSLAWGLKDSGLDVVVMDRKHFPRDKVCAGWITPAVLSALELNIEDYRSGRVFQPIKGFKVSVIGGKEVEARYQGSPVSYGIRRCEFDHYLLQRSETKLRLGESLEEMRREGDEWLVNDSIRAKLVVGAGGHFCPVARRMKISSPQTPSLIVAQEIEFLMSPPQSSRCSVAADMPELFFSEDFRGYSWVFRKGGCLNIGVGRQEDGPLAEQVRTVSAFLKKEGKIPQDTPNIFKGHAYLLHPHHTRRLIADGVMLIGDSAGFAYAASGEGIRPAVESGLLAAKVILEANGDYQEPSLRPYQEHIHRRFGAGTRNNGIAGKIPESLRLFLGRRLLEIPWFVRRVVMDQWFLRAHQPPLTSAPKIRKSPEQRPKWGAEKS